MMYDIYNIFSAVLFLTRSEIENAIAPCEININGNWRRMRTSPTNLAECRLDLAEFWDL